MKNSGFNIKLEQEHSEKTDYIFGAASPTCIALIPEEERMNYMPKGELQNIGEEKMDCASRAPVNKIEAKLTYLYQNNKLTLAEVNFFNKYGYVNGGRIECSDAYIAIKSGTTPEGNSLKAPCQAIHEWGLVPKSILPQLSTFQAHHNPARITSEIEAIAKEFKSLFNVGYDKTYEIDYLKDFYVEAGFAWPEAINGIYPRDERDFNHAWLGIKNPKHIIFDNYEESKNDFIKQLAIDYKLLEYQYRLYITRNITPPKKNIWQRFLEFLQGWNLKQIYKLNYQPT